MRFKFNPIQAAILTCLIPISSYADTSTGNLEPVIVTADLRETSVQDIPASVSVQTQADLQDQGATHFEDILLKTPNVNFSGQSSRPRHIQIRGMGEREDYTGALNASVGFAIDNVDFSGIGMAASLFDVKQVEVLRGPQNTTFAQSAVAGVINIKSNEPTDYRESMIEASAGQDNLKELGIMTSGPFSSKENAPQYRISLFKHDSDGFRYNKTLDKHDTNGRDELTAKAQLKIFPNSATTVDLSLMHATLDNGYDAWSRTNSFTTESNQPGQDYQQSNAGSVKVTSTANPNYILSSTTSFMKTKTIYSYDDDWRVAGAGWDKMFVNHSKKALFSEDLRFKSTDASRINGNTDWVAGAYISKLNSKSDTAYWTPTNNKYSIQKLATYGQFDIHTDNKTTVTIGGRIENSAGDFNNQDNEKFTPNETLWGLDLAYSYRYNDINTAYAKFSKGYKAGGFNANQAPPATPGINYPTTYGSETVYNYELGLKTKLENFKSNISVFYMDRKNPQLDGSLYDLQSYNWYYYTENLDKAQNYGLEADFDWQATPKINLFGSLGLLDTNVEGTPVRLGDNANSTGMTITTGREQAHAPNYQLTIGSKYRSENGFYTEIDATAVDSFYYDTINDQKTDPYLLVNARIGYETADYEVYLWGKNLTDERYATRGYYFDLGDGNGLKAYERLGDPRQLGVTARVYF